MAKGYLKHFFCLFLNGVWAMLLNLSLNDFVIVDALNLNFDDGFTVLTGETGAGKSITLDAIGLLLGDKADYSQIRHGANEARLSALFDIGHLPELQAQLYEQGLADADATELSVRRVIDVKGKSRNFINDQAATLAQLRDIGHRLIDIHGQNAHHSLNAESEQRRLLDAFAGALPLAESVKSAYLAWQTAQRQLDEAQQRLQENELERERLNWQYQELAKLDPQDGEWAAISHSHDELAHAAEYVQTAESVREYINGDNGLYSLLHRCQRQLQSLAGRNAKFGECVDMLAEAETLLDEVADQMRSVVSNVEINPSALAEQENRMGELMGMARKYRVEPEQLPEKMRQLQDAIERLEAVSDCDALAKMATECETQYQLMAQQLSEKRAQAAVALAQETTEYMQKLAMKGAQFAIELLPAAAGAHGLEHVQFQVAANQGTPLRPLNKVASGGELARISLALQVVNSQYSHIPTLIFDEVDSGIGGGVAETVGAALRHLGLRHQVLAITHLPQVASYGQHHWQVAKYDNAAGQTVSTIHPLKNQERVAEIARMLGGEVLTSTTLHHAAEMLQVASNRTISA